MQHVSITLLLKITTMTQKRFEEKIAKLRRSDRIAQLEVSRVVDLIIESQSREKLLDIGTGSALFAESFLQRDQNVTGVDPDPDMIIAARYYIPQINFLVANAENLPFTTNAFGISFMGMVLHETFDPIAALSEAKRVTRKLVAILEWPPPSYADPPPPANRFTPGEVKNIARNVGLSNITIHYLTEVVLYCIVV
jgi:ubiquinone/menaquinone biosynthesis C-methylase UbiE